MPVLRHLKTMPKRCQCFMCRHHQQTREMTRWMKAHPKKVAYLAEGELTSRHHKFNNQKTKSKSKSKK